jgi:hypothetical protein
MYASDDAGVAKAATEALDLLFEVSGADQSSAGKHPMLDAISVQSEAASAGYSKVTYCCIIFTRDV